MTPSEQSDNPERECNCLVPYLEGAGQHSPGCSIFTPEEREANRREHEQRARMLREGRL